MIQNHHNAGFVGAGIDFHFLADADETGTVVPLVLHTGSQVFQSIKLRAGPAGEGSHIPSVGGSHHFRCHSGVGDGNHIHSGKALQELAALVQGLLVGIDFLDLIDLHAGLGKQVVVDFQPEGTDNGEIVGDHQIVDLLHGARRGIFNGEDAVLAQALVDGVKDGFKILEVHDKGAFENLFAGNLGIGALHSLAGHHGRLGEQLRSILDGILDGMIQGALLTAALALVAAAQLKEHGVQNPGVVFHLGPRLLGDVLQLLALPAGHQNGQAVLLFIIGNLGGHIHSLAEQTNQFIIN